MVTDTNPSYYSVMNHEIELKLRLNTSELPLLEKVLASNQFISEPTLKLLNRYFDTPEMGLSQGGAALRIRQQGILETASSDSNSRNATEILSDERIIQTLKTRGTSSAGLHQRMEWDWPLTKIELDLNLLQTSEVQSHLSAELKLDTIAPLFTTDFQRKVWMYQQDETLIELVLDQGEVSTNEHRIDLLELELELKQGNVEVLFQLAQDLAKQCPVLMSDISKAERGYGLLAKSKESQSSQKEGVKKEGIQKNWQDNLPSFQPELGILASVKTFFAYQLSTWQRSLEFAIWDKKSELDETVVEQAREIKNLLALFSSIDCLPEAQLLQRQLALVETAKVEISLIWGQLSIACGHWLFKLADDNSELAMSQVEQHEMLLHVERLKKGLDIMELAK
jgi:triphosphatase